MENIGLELNLTILYLKQAINFDTELKFDNMFKSLIDNGFDSVKLVFENETIIESFIDFKKRYF